MNSRNITFACFSSKKFGQLILASLLSLFSFASFGQITTLAIQDFDLGTPGWSYSSDVAFFDNGTDGFFGVNSPFTPLEYPSLMDSVLYENDLDDEGDNGTTGFANVTFATVAVTGYNNVVMTFDYDIEGYNANNDEVLYEVFIDGVGQGQVTLQDGMDPGDDAEGTVTENIPNGTTNVGLVLSIRNNGASGFSAYDNFKVEGVLAGGATEVAFTSAAGSVNEAAGTYNVCVDIVNEDAVNATMVDIALTGGTATNGTDITTYATTTVTFPAGSAGQQCVTITITDDTIIDEGETLIFTLQNVMGGNTAIIGAVDETTVTIIDNDVIACDAPDWVVVSPEPAEEWSAAGTGFSANGFCGGGCTQDVQTWLIYGPLDMSGTSFLELSLNASESFGVTDLDVKYSSTEGANACPDEATWTSVGAITESGDFTFDFGAATATSVFIAIEYNDDGVGDGYSSWTLDNFTLGADVCPPVGVLVQPEVSAGSDIVSCGTGPVLLDGTGDGMWTGGAGTFDDATIPTATYTPSAAEEGTTVTLTYTLNLSACTGFSDDVNVSFLEEPGDSEFSYAATEICPSDGILSVMHTTGEDGIYTVTMGDATTIDLDPNTGDIDLGNTIDGTYEITNTIAGGGNLMISGVIDGPLTGGQPKAIEFYALDDIPDLSLYGFGSANNGNGGGVIEFTFPAVSVAAGTFLYLTDSGTDFNTFFGFAADFSDGAASINGDDALELFYTGIVIDVFGDVNTDGTGEPWDYLDGWAYRVNNTGPNTGAFDVVDFTYSGTNALDGETSNATAATPFPIGTFTTTQSGICPNSVSTFTVVIGDSEGPIIDCPSDIGVQLEPGECEEIVFFDVPFMDNCGTIDGEASQLVNDALVSTALDCQNNTSNHLRYYSNTFPVPLEITEVNFGIFNSGTTETITVNVYTIAPGAPFIYANMSLVGTVDQPVPAGMNNVILTAPVTATIPAGMDYVLELKANNTTNFVVGYNTLGETGSTFISGNDPIPCVSLEPVDIDVIGFGALAVVLYSNAEAGPSIEQTSGLPSGSYFPIGVTTQTFIATDINGNTTECTFDIEVFEFTNAVSGVLACNDNLNISLDQNCELVLLADMLLEGDVYGCYDNYDISVSGGVTGNVITNPGTYTVTVTDPDTGNSCWSTINVESKAVPVIDCASALCPIDMLEGEWTDADETFSPGAAWAFDGFAPNANILYDVIEFVVEVPGIYTLTMTDSDEFDGIAGIYEGSFDPANPALNLIGGDDDIAGVFESEPDFMIMLDAGTYFLVSSTWGTGQMGVYSWSFTGPGDLLSDCEVKCYELDALLSGDLEIPAPEVTSCIDFELYFSDSVDDSDCGTTIVTRTYVAENANGTSSCEVTFEIEPLSVALDLDLPTLLVELTCNDGVSPEDIVAIFDNPLTTDNPNTAIIENNEGFIHAYPTYEVNGHPQKVDNNVCNVYAGYTDQELAACEEGCNGNRKVIRTWTIVDWCTLETSTYIQTIKAVDTEAPTLLTKDITVSTDAWGCGATFEVPLPWELHDNCDDSPKYDVSGPAGVSIEGTFETGFTAIGTQKGVNTFNYIAYDCCGNEASFPFTVTVADLTPPVVVAKQNVVISLTSGSTSEDGLAKLFVESIDNGSFDGCSNEVKLEIRRDVDGCDVRGNDTYNADGHPQDGSPNPLSPNFDSDEGAFVKFCCDDITAELVDVNGDGVNDAGYHKVWLRVWDDGDMDGTFGSDGDNFNEAWAYVKVEDKLAPAIQCPPDVTLTCDMDYTDLDMTGSASAFGSCGGVDVEYNDIIINLNTCNEGFVRRRWNVVGRSDIFCDQTITLEDLDDADPVVSFSQVGDFTASNCPDDIALGEPTWIAGACDVLGFTVATDTFFFEDGACYKLVNTYTVINWCDYEPNNPFWDGSGIWEHVQVIKVTDETKPIIADCEDKMFAINDHSDSDDDGIVCEASIVLTNSAMDEGSANCPTGWLKWQVIVDLWGDGTPDLEYSSFLPPFDSQFNDTNGNGIGDVYVSPTENGGTVSIPLPDIEGSMSNHKVSWKVTDGCNNVTTCDSEFMIVDKKAPTPYMIDISSAVMDEVCTVDLWAIDFNLGSFDNCSSQEALRYTFTDTPPEDDNLYDDVSQSSSMTFTQADVENSPVEVNVYVWDEKGNSDFAVVFLTLIDNGCDGEEEEENPLDACTCDPTEFTGWAVGTCNADYDSIGAVGVIYDLSNTQDAPFGSDYGTSVTSIHPANWTIDQIGQVFGIAIDDNENVYLAASDVYDTGFDSDPFGPGQIFKASAGNNFIANPFVELPNTGGALNGIGNIAYCVDNSMLYASNLEDGMIYRINDSGVVMETYDPWTADSGSAGIVLAGEQVWGIGLNKEDGTKKLYFAKVDEETREMYSIELNSNGSFPSAGSESLEFANIMGTGMRISDIAFNTAGDQMIFSERGTKFTTGAHSSKTLRYDLNAGNWSMELQYFVGGFVSDDFPSIESVPGENSAGGVDFGPTTVGSSIEGCDELVWSSMNYFEDGVGGLFYGMQGMNVDGNNSNLDPNDPNFSTDIIIDYDEDYESFVQKGEIGDVEIFRCSGGDGNRPMIAGKVATAAGIAVAQVEMNLMSALPNYPLTDMIDGGFAFEDLPMNADYELTASKDIDYLNGVSTLDLVKIQRHILGLEDLDSPYKLIAADINADDKIKASDLSQLRKLILGVITDLPTNESWRFVNEAQNLDMDLNLGDVDYMIEIENLQSDMMDNNLVAVKVGDVTENATANAQETENIEVRSAKILELMIDNRAVKAGDRVEVDFTSTDFKDVFGYQFTMELNGLEMADVVSGAVEMTESNVGMLSDEVVTLSYHNGTAKTAAENESVFTIVFTATEDGHLSEMIDVTSKVTSAEAYISTSLNAGASSLLNAHMEIRDVVISTRGDITASAKNNLYQNEPNPFKDQTMIRFELAEAGAVTFTVTDMTGKLLKIVNTAGVKGLNILPLDSDDLGVTGILYYTIMSGEFTATKKMITVK